MRVFKRALNLPANPKRALAWRIDHLRGAGFEAQAAEALARDPAYDVPALLDLVDRGGARQGWQLGF